VSAKVIEEARRSTFCIDSFAPSPNTLEQPRCQIIPFEGEERMLLAVLI
jgi:hypothetical protein